MYLVIIAWLYVTLMMAVAEATNSTGTVLGAIITFVLYGLLPIALVVYLMSTPARRKAQKARALQQDAEQSLQNVVTPVASDPDAGSQPPTAPETGAVAPVREKL